MKAGRKAISAGLVLCIYQFSLIQAAGAATGFTPASVREQADNFGVGAKVAVKLAGGARVRGSITAIDEDGLVLAANNGSSQRVAYGQIAQLKLAQRAYRAKGDVDPAAARRVVANLGVGRHAVVKFGGKELHGNIQEVDAAQFTLVPDHEMAPVAIAYDQVQYVEKNITLGATIVLVVLIVAAVAVIATVAR